jgi:transcriptional regulator with XRE-family HTH domain
MNTPAERIAWAIDRSGKTLEQLAAEVGCSHAALSQWQTGATAAVNIKAGLLQAFADKTGTDVRWLLSGQGPVVSRYVLTSELQRVGLALVAMERHAPQQVETVVRMIEEAARAADPGNIL